MIRHFGVFRFHPEISATRIGECLAAMAGMAGETDLGSVTEKCRATRFSPLRRPYANFDLSFKVRLTYSRGSFKGI
jgi:hypothetical protein